MSLPPREIVQAAWHRIRERSREEVAPSLAERLRAMPRERVESALATLGPVDWQRILHDWEVWARPKQLPPNWPWGEWLLLGGRGSGKSRPASEFVDAKVRSGEWRTFALVGPDYQHVVKYMVGGEKGRDRNGSGLLDIARPWCRPTLIASRLQVEYPNGAVGHIVTADQPEFRGPNLDGAWCDEPTKWRYADRFITNLRLTLRELRYDGTRPQCVYTANPARLGFLLRMIADDGIATHVTHMTTRENAANLSAHWLADRERELAGTADGRRELDGEEDWFGDESSKLFPLLLIDEHRVDEAPLMERVVVSVDPGASTSTGADPTGIVGLGVDARRHVYVLEDDTEEVHVEGRRRAPRRKPEDWARAALEMLRRLGGAEVVVERNKGGDMASAAIRAAARERRQEVRVTEVYSKGDKSLRAHPVRVLYRAGEVHHVGRLAALEDEQTTWEPGMPSPNRLDALVTGVRALRGDILEATAEPVGAGEMEALARASAEPALRDASDLGAVAWYTGGELGL
jgi:phage terminase large subunit-like protein